MLMSRATSGSLSQIRMRGGTAGADSLEGGSGADLIRGTGALWTDTQGDTTRTGGDVVMANLTVARTHGV